MAKVKVEGFGDIAKAFDKTFETIITNESLLKEIGEEARTYIIGKTRSRADLSEEGAKQRPLEKSSIKTRRYMEKYNKTDPTYSPKRSNVTFTGQILNSIKVFISSGKIELRPDGNRQPYSTANGPVEKTPDNYTLAKYLEEKDRTFMAIDAKGQEILRQFTIRQIRRVLNTIEKIKI